MVLQAAALAGGWSLQEGSSCILGEIARDGCSPPRLLLAKKNVPQAVLVAPDRDTGKWASLVHVLGCVFKEMQVTVFLKLS